MSLSELLEDTPAALAAAEYVRVNAYDQGVRDLALRRIADLCPAIGRGEEIPVPLASRLFNGVEYAACNPSLCRLPGDRILRVVRLVNWTTRGGPVDADKIWRTRYVWRIDREVDDIARLPWGWRRLLLPGGPHQVKAKARGLEDLRLFVWRGAVRFLATSCEHTPENLPQVVMGRIEFETARLTGHTVAHCVDVELLPGQEPSSKNWLPIVYPGSCPRSFWITPQFPGPSICPEFGGQSVKPWRGPLRGSCATLTRRGPIAMVHEVAIYPGETEDAYCLRRYVQRWVHGNRISRAWIFSHRGIEFPCGMIEEPDGSGVRVTYGVDDREARERVVTWAEIERTFT